MPGHVNISTRPSPLHLTAAPHHCASHCPQILLEMLPQSLLYAILVVIGLLLECSGFENCCIQTQCDWGPTHLVGCVPPIATMLHKGNPLKESEVRSFLEQRTFNIIPQKPFPIVEHLSLISSLPLQHPGNYLPHGNLTTLRKLTNANGNLLPTPHAPAWGDLTKKNYLDSLSPSISVNLSCMGKPIDPVPPFPVRNHFCSRHPSVSNFYCWNKYVPVMIYRSNFCTIITTIVRHNFTILSMANELVYNINVA
ncbi:hypothetical protein K435DRAFT_840518, partial [Dendrothele bispora CBS 962.96]